MRYLSDSWQIHQCEVDNMRRKYLQMNGFIADPLQRDKERIDMYCVSNSLALLHRILFPLLAVDPDGYNILGNISTLMVPFLTLLGEHYSSCL